MVSSCREHLTHGTRWVYEWERSNKSKDRSWKAEVGSSEISHQSIRLHQMVGLVPAAGRYHGWSGYCSGRVDSLAKVLLSRHPRLSVFIEPDVV